MKQDQPHWLGDNAIFCCCDGNVHQIFLIQGIKDGQDQMDSFSWQHHQVCLTQGKPSGFLLKDNDWKFRDLALDVSIESAGF